MARAEWGSTTMMPRKKPEEIVVAKKQVRDAIDAVPAAYASVRAVQLSEDGLYADQLNDVIGAFGTSADVYRRYSEKRILVRRGDSIYMVDGVDTTGLVDDSSVNAGFCTITGRRNTAR